MEKKTQLIQLALKYHGDWDRIAMGLKRGEQPEGYRLEEPCITIYDEMYPPELRKLRFPPWVLFYRGSLELLSKPCITIVGSRDVQEYGEFMTRHVTELVADRFTIVSGLARGVDGIAHETALRCHAHTIGVTGCGLDRTYPQCNAHLYKEMEQSHLLLSEYPVGTEIQRRNFPWRNRILAALGAAVIVTQASLRSGTTSTAMEAAALGKEIWCIPYIYGDACGEGCNALIEQGANILYSDEQLEKLQPLQCPSLAETTQIALF